MKQIADKGYPKAKKITMVMDNFKTHTASVFYEIFEPKEAKVKLKKNYPSIND
ncbi:MAG TPA: hypothetical protein PLA68_04485 [Panacibacter sp.]|nr:hypothetical protein [Panacibacter sp.]